MMGMLLLLSMPITGGEGAWQWPALPPWGGERPQGWGAPVAPRVGEGARPRRPPADSPAAHARAHQAAWGEDVRAARRPLATSTVGHRVRQLRASKAASNPVPWTGEAASHVFWVSFLGITFTSHPSLTTPAWPGPALGASRLRRRSRYRTRRCSGYARARLCSTIVERGGTSAHSCRLRVGWWAGEGRRTPPGGRGWAGRAAIGGASRPAAARARRAGAGGGGGPSGRGPRRRARRQGGKGAVRPASLPIQRGATRASRW